MSNSYPDQGYQPHYSQEPDYQYAYEPEPKKRMSGWLIALIVVLVLIVVCCICACVAMVLLGPSMGTVFSDMDHSSRTQTGTALVSVDGLS